MRTTPSPGPKIARALCRAGVGIACLLAVATPALAVSTRDLVALAQAGLSDDLLVALIETDATVFGLDAPRILELRRQGLSERVLIAMMRSGQLVTSPTGEAPTATPADRDVDAPPLVAIGETPAPGIQVQQTSVIVVPWVSAFRPPGAPSVIAPASQITRGFGRFMNDGWVDGRPPSGAR